ncbi:hypothetical protein AAVH_09635 [Aphelenchoides avenae]|nr:hypothetical protein AAVH_09635 [Aphelenchus avenae]
MRKCPGFEQIVAAKLLEHLVEKLRKDMQNEAAKQNAELSDADAVMAVLAGSLSALNIENQRLKKDIKETKCLLKADK